MTASTTKRIPLNGTRLRAARLTQGLGTRDFARLAGTTFTVIDSIEKEQFISATTTLAEARRLAAAAGLSLADLLEPPVPSDPTTTTSDDDIQRLIGVLAMETRLTPMDDLAGALGWTLTRVDDTARLADTGLRPFGLRIHQSNADLCIRPLHPQALDDFEGLDQRRSARDSLNLLEGRLLYEALTGTLPDRTTHTEKPRLGRLTRLGMVRAGQRKEPFSVISDDARYAFDIPDVPTCAPTNRRAR